MLYELRTLSFLLTLRVQKALVFQAEIILPFLRACLGDSYFNIDIL
jgi:hypothetical protein